MRLLRLQAWLAGLWAGLLLTIGAIAAPSAFAVLARGDAGRLVGRLFEQEAYVSLAVAILLLIIDRWSSRSSTSRPALRIDVLLPLGALFCTIAGYFAVQPMMADARAGQGSWSFGALHAVSGGLYGLKALFVAALAWRLTAR